MTTKAKTPDLTLEQIEALANFSDHAADCPNLSFDEIAKLLGVDFTKAKNAKIWEKECRDVFETERSGSR
jgi:hypothetical protein